MDAFAMTEIADQQRQNGEFYHEFLRKERLSVGLYVLEAGATDPQSPHTEDEIYYIVSGAGIIEVDGDARAVGAGAVIYVDARVAHRFHSITEDLSVIVVFAPPRRYLAVQS